MRRISKAIAGFLVPGAAVLLEAMFDNQHGDLPTGREWLIAGVLSILTAGGVYVAPKNQP